MSFFPIATPAPSPRSKDVANISLFYAGILTVFAVAQLFTFDALLELFADFALPGGVVAGFALAAVLVALEVFAIPFLLRMRLSPAFRWFSGFAGVAVAFIWLCVSTWVVLSDIPVNTIGFLGTAVTMMPGWWAVLISIALIVLAVWSLWGMWPAGGKPIRKKR